MNEGLYVVLLGQSVVYYLLFVQGFLKVQDHWRAMDHRLTTTELVLMTDL